MDYWRLEGGQRYNNAAWPYTRKRVWREEGRRTEGWQRWVRGTWRQWP